MGKSTVNYNNPMRRWWRGWWNGDPEDWRIDKFLQDYERARAMERHADYSFEHAWPQLCYYRPWRSLGGYTPSESFTEPKHEPFPELREEFRQLFLKFWKEPV